MSLYPKRLRFYYVFLVFYFLFQVIFLIVLRSLNEDSHTNALKILEMYKKLSGKLNKNTELDNTGLYKIIHLKHLRNKQTVDITLISQCSSNHFPSVENLFKAWEGPISVSIFSEVENIERTLWDVARFIHCNSWRDFGLHLVVPTQDVYIKDYEFPLSILSRTDQSISCSSGYVSTEKEKQNYNWTSLYPVNLLRNVAKAFIPTDFVFVVDIDMIPSAGLRSDFLNFIGTYESPPEEVAYVVPVFEIPADVPTPLDKAELLRMVEANEARPFYVVPCENCQKLTRYDEWMESGSSHGEEVQSGGLSLGNGKSKVLLLGTRVLYQVEWRHPWEPFFIARRDVPNFDERFKQYGMNRVSQICELYVAGFKFLVLENVFLIHKGYKTSHGFHETKNKEMDANRRLYIRFKTEVKYKYPDSERRC